MLRDPLRTATVLLVTLVLAACGGQPETDPRFVSEWLRALYGAIRAERLSPPVASRLLAYAGTGLYAGLASASHNRPSLAAVIPSFPTLPATEPGREYDATLVAVAAERVVLDSLLREALPTTRASVARLADSIETARITLNVGDAVRDRSKDLGRRIGIAIVMWARTDGFDSTRGRRYKAPVGPGLWLNDAPGSTYASQNLSGATDFVALNNPANIMRAGSAGDRGIVLNRPKRASLDLPAANMAGATEPYWGSVRPFALASWRECPVPDPLPYSTTPASAFYRDAKEVVDVQTRLTPEQRTIALYWADNPGETATPTGHWVAIVSQMVNHRRLSAVDAAWLIAITAVAQADAFIAAWGYKYQFNLIRPRTYIRRVIDSTWEPLIPTPPFPEYPAGHSTQSASAAVVMKALLGDIAFEDSSAIAIGHSVRKFASFDSAAAEAGWSRIYGGIHFRSGNSGGRLLGQCIGAKIVERLKATGSVP